MEWDTFIDVVLALVEHSYRLTTMARGMWKVNFIEDRRFFSFTHISYHCNLPSLTLVPHLSQSYCMHPDSVNANLSTYTMWADSHLKTASFSSGNLLHRIVYIKKLQLHWAQRWKKRIPRLWLTIFMMDRWVELGTKWYITPHITAQNKRLYITDWLLTG